MNPWDGSTPPPGLVPPHLDHDHNTGDSYPDTQSRTLSSDNSWEYQNTRPSFKRTTFCSRIIRFTAKDETVLSFNTFSGLMNMYISTVMRRGEVVVMARMLRPDEEGLGGVVNVVMEASVDCDTISLNISGQVYKLDYSMGRLGVKDLEVLGRLESTGMIPRGQRGQERPGSVRNFIEQSDWSQIQLRPSPVDSQPDQTDDDETQSTDDEDDKTSVVEDTYLVRFDFKLQDVKCY